MHELAHAIFDIEASAASLDFSDDERKALEELRADAFAQEALIPKVVLNHIVQTAGLKWDRLGSYELALLVANAQVEQRAIVKAALEYGFLTPVLAEQYINTPIHDDLKSLTERALSTQEFIQSQESGTVIRAEDRTTTVPSRALRLPLPYVCKIVQLTEDSLISVGKAAQMLMIDKDTLFERFKKLEEVNA